jgi:gas vesicle protein
MADKSKFLGFVFGGVLGASLGLLYAPRSGDETRQILIEDTNRMTEKAIISIQSAQDKAVATIQESQARLEALNQETKERLAKLQEIAQNTLETQRESLEQGYEDVKEVLSETETVD